MYCDLCRKHFAIKILPTNEEYGVLNRTSFFKIVSGETAFNTFEMIRAELSLEDAR